MWAPEIKVEPARSHSRCTCCYGEKDLASVVIGHRDGFGNGNAQLMTMCRKCRGDLACALVTELTCGS